MPNRTLNAAEHNRILFVFARDGDAAAIEFARRTFAKYRECLRMDGRNGRKLHHASLPQYRRSFIESCLEFRRFLRTPR